MRMAMTFSIAAETPNMIRRMRKEDDQLKDAIGKHYKKLCTLERERSKNLYRFSDSVTDLMKAIGFKPSERHRGELSEESERNNNRDDVTSDTYSESVTVYSESRYTSMNIDEDR